MIKGLFLLLEGSLPKLKYSFPSPTIVFQKKETIPGQEWLILT